MCNLWIRSQDKMQFHKVYDVFIAKLLDVETGKWGVFVNHTTFGYYKTEERALEVLDEIQKLLMGQDIMVFHNIGLDYDGLKSLYKKAQEDRWVGLYSGNIDSEKIEYISPNCIVYEMPKE